METAYTPTLRARYCGACQESHPTWGIGILRTYMTGSRIDTPHRRRRVPISV